MSEVDTEGSGQKRDVHLPPSLSRHKSWYSKYRESRNESRGYSFTLALLHKDDAIRYAQYRRHDFPLLFFFLFMLFVTAFWILGNAAVFNQFDPTDRITSIGLAGCIISAFGNVLAGWAIFGIHYIDMFYKDWPLSAYCYESLGWLEAAFIVCAPIGPGFNLLAASSNPDCEQHLSFLEITSQLCNPESSVSSLPQYITLIVFLSPVFCQAMIKCSTFSAVFGSWIASIFFITLSLFISKSYASALFPLFDLVFGIYHYEVERRDLDFFMKLKQLYVAEEKVRQQEEDANRSQYQTLTLNRIISNVSHDLISPLQALEMGFETLLNIIQQGRIADAKPAVKKPSYDRFPKTSPQPAALLSSHRARDDDISADLVHSMRGTLLFMSGVINRCLDVCTASGGTPLVPHFELFDVVESINRTCRCVSDMQTRFIIRTGAWPPSVDREALTDKRWFEGNLLCLLSNAVKFSSDSSEMPIDVVIDVSAPKAGSSSTAQFLTVEVIDSGKPLTESERQAFFLPPEQTGRMLMGGSGMGLFALAKRVESLGGTFGSKARSDGRSTGSAVWFSIPLNRAPGGARKKVRITSPMKRPSLAEEREDFVANNFLSGSAANESNSAFLDDAVVRDHRPSPTAARRTTKASTSPAPSNSASPSPSISASSPQAPVSSASSPQAPVSRDPRPPNPRPVVPPLELSRISPPPPYTPEVKKTQPGLELNAVVPSSQTKVEPSGPESGVTEKKALSVLVVDDAITIMKITKMSLEREGHHVDQAHNGEVALKMMKMVVYDVVLMDIQMPVMNGVESTAAIRAFEAITPAAKPQVIIGMSANGDADTRQEAMSAGMNAFIPKPFSLYRMMKVLTELNTSDSPQVPPASAPSSPSNQATQSMSMPMPPTPPPPPPPPQPQPQFVQLVVAPPSYSPDDDFGIGPEIVHSNEEFDV